MNQKPDNKNGEGKGRNLRPTLSRREREKLNFPKPGEGGEEGGLPESGVTFHFQILNERGGGYLRLFPFF